MIWLFTRKCLRRRLIPLGGTLFLLLTLWLNRPHLMSSLGQLALSKSLMCRVTLAPDKIIFRNDQWQVADYRGQRTSLYGAYLDRRSANDGSYPLVRIFGVSSAHNTTAYCQLWYFASRHPLAVVANVTAIGRGFEWGRINFMEYMYTCKLPSKLLVPDRASLVFQRCQTPLNVLNVISPAMQTSERKLGICVPLTYDHIDIHRLVEWIEFTSILGVHEIHIYNSSLSQISNMIMGEYEKDGLLKLHSAPPPIGPIKPKEKNMWLQKFASIAALQDCMYRNMYRYRYVIIMDLDEIIIPRTVDNYNDMLNLLEKTADSQTSNAASYMFSNAYFWLDIPPDPDQPGFLTTQRYLKRSHPSPLGYASKSFIDPRRCVVVNNHYCPIRTPDVGDDWVVPVSEDIALSQHYKRCHFSKGKCKNETKGYEDDDSALRFQEGLRRRVTDKIRSIFNWNL